MLFTWTNDYTSVIRTKPPRVARGPLRPSEVTCPGPVSLTAVGGVKVSAHFGPWGEMLP